jgi:uncharacterized protein
MGPRGLRVAGLAAAALVVAGAARAQSLPALTAPVNDGAGVIDSGSAATLDNRIRSLERTTGDVVVVATVQRIAPYSTIEEYAVKLFEQSGIGQKQHDNGVLVVVAVGDRKVRIEVGYGLEEFVTDGFAGETIRQAMLPAFRDGRYGPGLVDGVTRVIQRIAQGRGVTLQDVPAVAPSGGEGPGLPVGLIIFLVILGLHVIGRIARGGRRSLTGRRRRGPWSGWYGGPFGGFGGGGFGGGFGGRLGGGGGFGGFGGGRSGGGGASGGW